MLAARSAPETAQSWSRWDTHPGDRWKLGPSCACQATALHSDSAAAAPETMAYCQEMDCHVAADWTRRSARAMECADARHPQDGPAMLDGVVDVAVAAAAAAGDETVARMASSSLICLELAVSGSRLENRMVCFHAARATAAVRKTRANQVVNPISEITSVPSSARVAPISRCTTPAEARRVFCCSGAKSPRHEDCKAARQEAETG